MAWSYFSFFMALTIYKTIILLTTLAGIPIVLASRRSAEKNVTKNLSSLWCVLGILGSLILSGKEPLNDDVVRLKLGDNMLSLKSSNDEAAIFKQTEEKSEEEDMSA